MPLSDVPLVDCKTTDGLEEAAVEFSGTAGREAPDPPVDADAMPSDDTEDVVLAVELMPPLRPCTVIFSGIEPRDAAAWP